MIQTKRVYESSSKDDGFRILVDKIWPKGVSKERPNLNLWMKKIASSDNLRKWLLHDPKKWEEFGFKYKEELKDKNGLISKINEIEKDKKNVTLIYSAKDKEHNNAIVLLNILKKS